MQQSVLVNGINISWKNINFVCLNVPLISITEISYEEDMVKKNNFGIGQNPTSRGYGNQDYKGSITLLTDEVRQLAAAAAAQGLSLLTIPPFSASIIFDGEGGTGFYTDTLGFIDFTSNPFKAAQGSTGIYITLPFIFAGIKRT
jgi:hypothetical protein